MKKIIGLLVLCYLMLIGCGFAQGDNRSLEIVKLTLGLESTNEAQRINSAKFIFNFKLKDQALHEKVAEILSNGYQQEMNAEHLEEMSWMCKALAVSEDLQYIQLLKNVALESPSEELRNNAMESAGLIYNAQKSIQLNTQESFSKKQNQLIDMLKSGNLNVRRNAAKSITLTAGDYEPVYIVVEETLLAMVDNFRNRSLNIDTMAWLCKALASSGDSRYVEVLKDVRSRTSNLKLHSHINKALGLLDISPSISTQDNTFFDENSGMTWYLVPEAGRVNNRVAKRVCRSFEAKGYGNRRIPTLREFKQLWHHNKYNRNIEIFNMNDYIANDVNGLYNLMFSFETGTSNRSHTANVVCVEG